MCETIIRTYDTVAPNTGDVDEQRAVLGDGGEQEADQAGDDQCEVRRLAGAGPGQPARQVAGPRQGEQLPRVGEDDREEAGDQAGQADVVDEVGQDGVAAVRLPQRQRQRVVGVRDDVELEPPGAVNRMSAAATEQEHHRAMIPRGMSFFGFRDSSAASGTPSIARKNQMP
jgi:hypothetical protein